MNNAILSTARQHADTILHLLTSDDEIGEPDAEDLLAAGVLAGHLTTLITQEIQKRQLDEQAQGEGPTYLRGPMNN